MNHQILQNYINSHNLPIIEKDYHKYLTFESLEEDYTYILKDGIVKQSVLSKYGTEFNLRYVTGLEITSILNTDYSQHMGEPYNVRIESETAHFYKVRRSTFLKDINNDIELQGYVKDFYHNRLEKSMKKCNVCSLMVELVLSPHNYMTSVRCLVKNEITVISILILLSRTKNLVNFAEYPQEVA